MTPVHPLIYHPWLRAWPGAALLIWLLLAGAALAPVAVSAQEGRATVRVDGRAIFRVSALPDVDAVTRAQRIEQRLQTLLENPQAIVPAQVEITGPDGGERVITVAGVAVVTVTTTDAQDNLTTVEVLATQWARAIHDALARGQERRLAPGGRFLNEVRAQIEAAFARLAESAVRVVPRTLAALVVIALFGLLAAAVRWLTRFFFQRVTADATLQNLIKQLVYYAIWALGLVVAVDAFGFDPQTVIAGLGLTGLALGFALKDIISNFVSGILLLAMRPFQLGDQIVIGPTEGSIERIQLRATHIRTYDGRLVLVPNAEVFTARVTNNTASPVRRGSVEVMLDHDTDLRRAVALFQAVTQATPGVLPEPGVSIRVRDLEPTGVRVEARFWTDSRRSDYLATASAVRLALMEATREARITLADSGAVRLLPQNGATDETGAAG